MVPEWELGGSVVQVTAFWGFVCQGVAFSLNVMWCARDLISQQRVVASGRSVCVCGGGGWRHLNGAEVITWPFWGCSYVNMNTTKHEFQQVLKHWLSNVFRIDCLRFMLIFGSFTVSCGFCNDCICLVAVVVCVFLFFLPLHLQHTVLYKNLQITFSSQYKIIVI